MHISGQKCKLGKAKMHRLASEGYESRRRKKLLGKSNWFKNSEGEALLPFEWQEGSNINMTITGSVKTTQGKDLTCPIANQNINKEISMLSETVRLKRICV